MNELFNLGFRMKSCDFYQFDTSRIDLLKFSFQCKIVNKKKAIDNNVLHDTICSLSTLYQHVLSMYNE